MIVDLIVGAVLGIFTALINLIPNWTLDLGQFPAGGAATLTLMNEWLPVTDVFAATGVAVGARLFVSAFAFIQWCYDKLPFKAT